MSLIESIRSALRPSGLNLLGVAGVAAYDAQVGPVRRSATLHPGARSILVVANGGPALWESFLDDLKRNPRHLTQEPHPLEAFVRREIEKADTVLGDAPRSWFFAASDARVQLDFRLVAHLAGLGARSRLELLMHPVHGTWVGLRAACFLEVDLSPTPHIGASPCETCAAPCLSACPGDAFPDGRWDVDRCAGFHRDSDRCRSACHARNACPEGIASRYGDDEIRYHTDGVAGRRWLRAHVGVTEAADSHPATPPLWDEWRARIDVKG